MTKMDDTQIKYTIYASFLILCCIGLIALGIHYQIPDQGYCDDVIENRYHEFGGMWYTESLTTYDYAFNQSKCIYNNEGTFIANPKYSIWGIRI